MSALTIPSVRPSAKPSMPVVFSPKPLATADLISLAQLTADEIHSLFATTAELKKRPRAFNHVLDGSTIVMLFEKDSLRTLTTFEVGMAKLGGRAVYLDHRYCRIGQREPIRDY